MKTAMLLALMAAALLVADAGYPCTSGSCKTSAPCVTDCDCPEGKSRCLVDVTAGTSRCSNTTKPPREPIFFVHIPKTGGTTFKYSFIEAIGGREHICSDYGPKSPNTSKLVRAHMYSGAPDLHKFIGQARQVCALVAGHMSVDRYVRQLGLRRTVTIIRHPLPRKLSQYFHMQRNERIPASTTFLQYISRGRGRVTEHLSGALNSPEIPLQAYGMLALTERYADSIAMFNAAFGMSLPHLHENAGTYELPAEAKDPAIRALFEVDELLYRRAEVVFAERKRMLDACLPYVHGALDSTDAGAVRGWAWWGQSDEPVEVALLADGTRLATALADQNHRLAQWGAPRGGLVGFTFDLPEDLNARVVRVEAAVTGQVLGEVTSYTSQFA